jgi:hypothetical protein
MNRKAARRDQIAERSVRQAHLHEAAAGGGAHLGGEETPFDGEHVDAGGVGRGRFLGRGDVEHRDLAHALEGAQVGDGRALFA